MGHLRIHICKVSWIHVYTYVCQDSYTSFPSVDKPPTLPARATLWVTRGSTISPERQNTQNDCLGFGNCSHVTILLHKFANFGTKSVCFSGDLTSPLAEIWGYDVSVAIQWLLLPLSSERTTFHLEFKVKFRLDSRTLDKILVQNLQVDCIRNVPGGC